AAGEDGEARRDGRLPANDDPQRQHRPQAARADGGAGLDALALPERAADRRVHHAVRQHLREARAQLRVAADQVARLRPRCGRRSSSIGRNSIGPETATPALLTRPASGVATDAAAASIDAPSVTSILIALIDASLRRCASSSFRTPASTSKPSDARWRAVASP